MPDWGALPQPRSVLAGCVLVTHSLGNDDGQAVTWDTSSPPWGCGDELLFAQLLGPSYKLALILSPEAKNPISY